VTTLAWRSSGTRSASGWQAPNRSARIAFAEGGDIHVFPVNHCVLDGLVAFRTGDGTKLGAAVEGSVVAFEVDRYDADRRTGWSVLVKGRVEVVPESTLLLRLRTAGLQTWRNRMPRPEWLVIRPDIVTGRRL